MGLLAAAHRLRDQGARGAGTHLAARRARGGTDADLDDPRRRAPEARRVRHPADLLPDLSGRRTVTGLARLRLGRGVDGLRRLRRPGPKGLQADGGLQFRQPHGLRHAGPRGVERGRRPRLPVGCLGTGRERRHVSDARPRHQFGGHVLHGGRAVRPRAPPQSRGIWRHLRQDAGLQRAGHRHLLRRPRPAGALWLHRRGAGHPLELELQPCVGRGLRVHSDPHGGLHPLGDPACVSRC